jgi:hypothetical protein
MTGRGGLRETNREPVIDCSANANGCSNAFDCLVTRSPTAKCRMLARRFNMQQVAAQTETGVELPFAGRADDLLACAGGERVIDRLVDRL